LKQYARFYLKDTGISIDWQDILHYDLSKTFNATKYKYLYDPTFYDTIDEMPMAVEHVNRLHDDGHIIYFCTACVTDESVPGKMNLLRRTFDWFDIEKYIVMSRKKYLYDAQGIIVDDSPYLFNESQMPINICYAWKHNEKVRSFVDLYTSDWRDIYNFISEIANNPQSAVEKSLQASSYLP
jgi:5'(3')-deoxyribonucleotidase